jgi:hypothetical protein
LLLSQIDTVILLRHALSFSDFSRHAPQTELLEVPSKKKVISKVNEKGFRNKPLTAAQKATNREKSKTRARVEHVFGFV